MLTTQDANSAHTGADPTSVHTTEGTKLAHGTPGTDPVGHADTVIANDTQDTDPVTAAVSTNSRTQCSGTLSASSPAGESAELDAPATQHAD